MTGNVIRAVSANGYWGMADPSSNAGVWIRTTNQGIIPYQSGGAGNGHQSLGTSGWYFKAAYIDNIYGTVSNADKLDGVHNGEVTAKHLYPAGGVSNFNTLTGNGIYSWGANVTGQPNNYGSVFQFSNVNNPVPGSSNHWVTQLASSTNNRLYYRTRTNTGSWNSWHTLAFTTDVPTVTNYYWANVKVSSSSSTSTSPTFSTAYTSNWFRSTGSTGWYS